jgi:hypothetical protein
VLARQERDFGDREQFQDRKPPQARHAVRGESDYAAYDRAWHLVSV